MSIKVQFAIGYDFRLDLCFGHNTLEGKHIVLEHGDIYQFCDYNEGKVMTCDCVVIVANLVLHSTVVSLDVCDLFVLSRDVKLGVQIGKVATTLPKLIVKEHADDFKTSGDVCTNQGFEVL